jgi:hypothetical protein
MQRRFHPIVLKEFNRESCGVQPGIVHKHYQVRSLSGAPDAGHWDDDESISVRNAWRRICTFFENIYEMETARIPRYHQHDFFGKIA